MIEFLAATESGRWTPGIGDPTFFGWLCVVLYFLAAWLCWRAGKLERRLEPGSSPLPTGWPELARHAWESLRATLIALRADPRGQSSKRQLLPTFWFVLCGMMVFLGFNKQLDLQTCFTQVGRDLARSEGWYQERRVVQLLFVVFMLLLGMATVAASWWYIHSAWRRYRIAFLGIIYLVVFVIIRAASFHHVDIFLKSSFAGLAFNHILEVSGIVFIAYSAWSATRQLPRQPLKAFEKTVRIR